jgi:hypothetical protein
MDELFFLPSSPVAMPRAYWLPQPGILTSALIVLQPSTFEWQRIQEYMTHDNPSYDMEILNAIYSESSIVLPHHRYFLLSAEFRNQTHYKYLGSNVPWDGPKALRQAKYVHFSDWPVPKPWLQALNPMLVGSLAPVCAEAEEGGRPDCTDRDLWLWLYEDFRAISGLRLKEWLTLLQKICGRRYDGSG